MLCCSLLTSASLRDFGHFENDLRLTGVYFSLRIVELKAMVCGTWLASSGTASEARAGSHVASTSSVTLSLRYSPGGAVTQGKYVRLR